MNFPCNRKMAVAAACTIAASLLCASAALAQPALKGAVSVKIGMIGGRQRRYILYVPPSLQPGGPLVFVLHGGGGDGPLVRQNTGFEFDMLADANGFVVVYPDGIAQGWNSCRRRINNEATQRKVDDVAFIEAIIAHEAASDGIDRKRVFAAGVSFGGQMAFRLALERPNEFAGIAAISSNLPVQADNGCTPAGVSIPVMIINGTDDPVNPYRGGRTPRGTTTDNVLSTEATAAYFAGLPGNTGSPEIIRLPHRDDSDATWVERATWTSPTNPVILYAIHGGGHVVPQPYYRYPVNLGRQTKDLDAPTAIWEFFSGLPGR
jgi:polyhydroxybutyrate depolymerase